MTLLYSVFSSQTQMTWWIAPVAGGGVGSGLAVDPGTDVGLALGLGVALLGPALAPTPDADDVSLGVAEPEADVLDPREIEPVAAGPPAGLGSTTNTARMAMRADKAPMSDQRSSCPITLHDRRSRSIKRYPRESQVVGPPGPDGVAVCK